MVGAGDGPPQQPVEAYRAQGMIHHLLGALDHQQARTTAAKAEVVIDAVDEQALVEPADPVQGF